MFTRIQKELQDFYFTNNSTTSFCIGIATLQATLQARVNHKNNIIMEI